MIAKIKNHPSITPDFFKSRELNKYKSNQSRQHAGSKYREKVWEMSKGANNHKIVIVIIHVKTKYSHNFINILKNSVKLDCLNVKIKSRPNSFKYTPKDHKTPQIDSLVSNIFGIRRAFSEILSK